MRVRVRQKVLAGSLGLFVLLGFKSIELNLITGMRVRVRQKALATPLGLFVF